MKNFVLSFLLFIICVNALSAQFQIWGNTSNGGRFGMGTIFRWDKENGIYETMHDFHPSQGGHPYAPLLEAQNGYFYGTTTAHGDHDLGTIFSISPTGEFKVLKHFDLCDGANPFSGLSEGAHSVLYGMTTDGGNNGFGTIYRINTDGTGFQVLWHFSSFDGARPEGSLIRGEDGAFYGMTSEGGKNGMGTMFRFTGDGKDLSIFHHFNWEDGAYPYGAMLQNCDGKLYGVTHCGGKNGVGTIFTIHRNGNNFKVLHHFQSSQGAQPYSDLIEGCDGILYGTTNEGGKFNGGVVFSIGTEGQLYKVLHHLEYNADGGNPQGGLREDNGILYGTASFGANKKGGSIFSLKTDGSDFRVLRHLQPDEGSNPHSRLTQPRPEVARPEVLDQKIQPNKTKVGG